LRSARIAKSRELRSKPKRAITSGKSVGRMGPEYSGESLAVAARSPKVPCGNGGQSGCPAHLICPQWHVPIVNQMLGTVVRFLFNHISKGVIWDAVGQIDRSQRRKPSARQPWRCILRMYCGIIGPVDYWIAGFSFLANLHIARSDGLKTKSRARCSFRPPLESFARCHRNLSTRRWSVDFGSSSNG
jgi:hypothetical protein